MRLDIWSIVGAVCASVLSMLFSTLTYSLRDYSRPRLHEALEKRGMGSWFDNLLSRTNDLIFTTAIGRMFANLLILIFILELSVGVSDSRWIHYLVAVAGTALISMFCSVAIPHALSRHAGEAIIAGHARFLFLWRGILAPLTKLMNVIDSLVRRLAGISATQDTQEKAHDFEQEVLAVVEEGSKDGVVDEAEKEMITSVIEFGDTQVGQIMTARPEIVAVTIDTSLEEIARILEESGHSRVPVYENTLDKIVGAIYARDLLQYISHAATRFDIRAVMRQPLYVPKTKNLRDLLNDFRVQKIHIAIVLDEYGGTAGLVTIEDVLEELVGDISDEHEPHEPAMLKKISDNLAEVDARIYIDELNRNMGMSLPEDEGFDTLGGFLTTTIGRIPQTGTTFEHAFVRYTVLDAEPQKVNRVRIELLAQPAEAPTSL